MSLVSGGVKIGRGRAYLADEQSTNLSSTVRSIGQASAREFRNECGWMGGTGGVDRIGR